MDYESGGILIGKRRGEHFEVTIASSPQAQDVQSRCRFTRLPNGHQKIAEERWLATDGEDNYLGEWHTHPENFASPSGIDIREWKKLSRLHNVPLVVIIVGLERSYFGLLTGSAILTLTESG
jgi:integrative and conjugative element protein (TIGR02256 family)